MIIKKNKSKIKYLYHYTPKENVESIIQSGVIKSQDDYTFFTDNYYKSISLFEEEMMSNKYHITIDKKLERRSYANPEDYRIIKIPYKNDGNFVKMIFEGMKKDSIYNISTIHKGNLYFEKEKVEVLPVSVQKGMTIKFPILAKLAFILNVFTAPIMAKADTWIDSEEYYNLRWFNANTYATTNGFTFTTKEDIAGLSYVTNVLGYTFEGKTLFFKYAGCSSLYYNCELDMTEHDWVPLPESFAGVIDTRRFNNGQLCGWHYLQLGYEKDATAPQFKAGDNKCTIFRHLTSGGETEIDNGCRYVAKSSVAYHVYKEDSEHGSITLGRTRLAQYGKGSFTLNPDPGYKVNRVTITTTDGQNVQPSLVSNTCSYSMPNSDITVRATFKKETYTIRVNVNHARITPDASLASVEYQDSRTITIQPNTGYQVVGYQMNGGDIVEIEDPSFTIPSVEENLTIDIIVEPIHHTITNKSKDKNYLFYIEEPFNGINEVRLCSNNNCKKLKTREYKIKDQDITILKSLSKGEYRLEITFDNSDVSTIEFRVEGNGSTDTEKPQLINPNTKSNLIVLLGSILVVIIAFLTNKKKKTREK